MDINQQIDNMAETMEKSSKSKEFTLSLIKSTVIKLGKDGLKKAVPGLSIEQRTLLNEVLEDMKKGSATLEPLSNTTDDGDEKDNEKKPRHDKRDEEMASEAKKKDQAEVRHQGGVPVEGWEGQVIKSMEKAEGEGMDAVAKGGSGSGRKPVTPGLEGVESVKNLRARGDQQKEVAAKFAEGKEAMGKAEEAPKEDDAVEKSAENPEGKKEDAEIKKEPMMSLDDKKKTAKANLKKMMTTMMDRKMEKSVCVAKLAKTLEVEEGKVGQVWDEIAKAYKMIAPAEAAAQSPVPSQMKDGEGGKVQEGEDPSVPKYKDKAAKNVDGPGKAPLSGAATETADATVNKAPSLQKSYFTEDEAMYIAKSEANPFAHRTLGQNKHYQVDEYIELEQASKTARLSKSTFDYVSKSEADAAADQAAQVNDNQRKNRMDTKDAKEEVRQIKTDEKLNIISDKAGPKMPFVKAKMKKSWAEGLLIKGLDMNASQAFVAQTNRVAQAEGAKLVKSFSDEQMDALFAEQDMYKSGK